MKNPYEHLVIYNYDGVADLGPGIERDPRYLGTWVEEGTSFVFFSGHVTELTDALNRPRNGVLLIDVYEMTCEQWHGDRIEPYFVEDLLISPPWDRAPCPGGKKEILLDPGVVFGTGRHQTTEDCLGLIRRVCTKDDILSVLDIGTGTGLLAVGAAALGCKRVLACDFNFLAVKTARHNIAINGFGDRVLAFQARGEEVLGLPCDLLVANIHYDVMQHLIEDPALRGKRYVLLSGLLISEAKKVIARLKEKNFRIIQHRCPDGVWNTILAAPLKNHRS